MTKLISNLAMVFLLKLFRTYQLLKSQSYLEFQPSLSICEREGHCIVFLHHHFRLASCSVDYGLSPKLTVTV